MRSRSLTSMGTSGEVPRAPCSSSAGPGRALHPHQWLLWVPTGCGSGTSGEPNVRLFLCCSAFADLHSDPQLLPLLTLPHCSHRADRGAASCSPPLKRGFQGNCKASNAKHATWISGIHIPEQSNYKQLSMLRNVYLY